MVSDFARLLRNHRLAVCLSQEELAEAACVSTAAIGAYERGVRLAPHRVTLDRLADALRLTGADRAHFTTSTRRKLAHPHPPEHSAVVGLWRTLLETQSDEQLSATAATAIELLAAINDTVELAACWMLLSERLGRAGQRARARAARNCAQALCYENETRDTRSA